MGKGNQQESPDDVVRDYRLDIVKAISISLVLVWHLQPIKIVVGESPQSFLKISNFIIDQLYKNFTLIAVPLFILTSLFLLFQKFELSTSNYLFKRCRRLLEIFIFWCAFQFLIYYSVSLIQSIRANTAFSWHIPDLNIYNLLAGTQPTLPLVGDSVFYFLLRLLELTIISYVFLYWKNSERNNFKDYGSAAIIIILLVYFEVLNLTGKAIPYWRLDNFLIYVPIAYFMIKQGGRIPRKYILTLYLLFLVFGLQDIFLRVTNHKIGIYSRISVICGASAVFSSCLNLRNWEATESIKFLSRFSLGIFAIHKYWQLIIMMVVHKIFQILGLPTKILIIDTLAIFVALATTLLTCISVILLNRTPFTKFIK